MKSLPSMRTRTGGPSRYATSSASNAGSQYRRNIRAAGASPVTRQISSCSSRLRVRGDAIDRSSAAPVPRRQREALHGMRSAQGQRPDVAEVETMRSWPGRVLCALVMCVLCVPSGTAIPADLTVVRVGSISTEPSADILYAREEGFFRDAGLDVQVDLLMNGGNLIPGAVGGTYDISNASLVATAVAREKGLPVRLIAPAGIHVSSAPTDMLMVAKSSTVRSARDFDGKTIAVSGLGNMSFVGVRTWITKNGGDVGSVHFIEFLMSAMPEALQLGRIDAALMTEPFITNARDVARPLANPYDAVALRFITAGWIATDGWLQKNPDTARRFVAAMRKAHDWANTHPKESAPILVRYTKMTPEMVDRMTRVVFGTALDPQMIQPVLDAGNAAGVIPRPMAAGDLIWQPAP
jgi:NitT/TauT family transport system substrate-binding protein